METSTVNGAELLAFLDREVTGGRLNAGTASSRRSAVRAVLQAAFASAWQSSRFAVADVPQLLARFDELHADDFTVESLRSYRSNFRRTVELMLGDGNEASTQPEAFTYRFPVRPNFVAEMSLPVDLTAAEARRLSALILALTASDPG
jgi:hypothetical protein